MAGSLIFLPRPIQLAVLDDKIQVHPDQASQRSRQHPDMGGEKALQGESAQIRAAAQGFEDKVANKGNTSRDLRTVRRRPIRRFDPREANNQ